MVEKRSMDGYGYVLALLDSHCDVHPLTSVANALESLSFRPDYSRAGTTLLSSKTACNGHRVILVRRALHSVVLSYSQAAQRRIMICIMNDIDSGKIYFMTEKS